MKYCLLINVNPKSVESEDAISMFIEISATEHDPDMMIIRYDKPLAWDLIDSEINEEVEIPPGGKPRVI